MNNKKEVCNYSLTNEQKRAFFEEAAKPLIKYLCEFHDPHTKVIVEPDGALLLGGEISMRTDEFIQD